MPSRIRLLHGCPAHAQLNGFCGDTPIGQNIAYNGCSDYRDIDYGSHHLAVYLPQAVQQPLATAYTFIPENSYHTAVFGGMRDNPSMFVVPDGYTQSFGSDRAFLRFVNLALDAPCLDFRFTDGAFGIANNIRYQDVTQYYPVTPSTYRMQAMVCDSNFVVLDVPAITLAAGRSYTLYITGSARVQPYCSHIIVIDCLPQRPLPPPRPPFNDYYPSQSWNCNCFCTPAQQSAPTIWEPCCGCSHHHDPWTTNYYDNSPSFWESSWSSDYSGGGQWHDGGMINYGSSYYHSYNDF